MEQKGGGEADGDGGRGAEPGSDGEGGAQGVNATREVGRGEREEEVEERGGGGLVDFADLGRGGGRDWGEVGLHGFDEFGV